MVIREPNTLQSDILVRQHRYITNLVDKNGTTITSELRKIIELGIDELKNGKNDSSYLEGLQGTNRINGRISAESCDYIKDYAFRVGKPLSQVEREIVQLGINKLDEAEDDSVDDANDNEFYTGLLALSVKNNIWNNYKNAVGVRGRKILYTTICKEMRRLVVVDQDVSKISVERVREYFKSEGYETASYKRVSVDELISKLGD